jgi:acetyl esterase/lipase
MSNRTPPAAVGRSPAPGRAAPAPAFDPELAAALEVIRPRYWPARPAGDDSSASRPGAAAALVDEPAIEDLDRGGTFAVAQIAVPGPPGEPDVRLLTCRPTNIHEAVPAVYHVHGGGMMAGSNRLGIGEILDWAGDLGMAVVSVEYRLAPQTRHPGPVMDCYAGLLWTSEHSREMGIDPSRLILAGSSAGGGLAAAAALLARDRGGPLLAGQMLMMPMLDDRNDTVSAVQMARLGLWDRASNEAGWTALLGTARGGPTVSPYAAPARAVDLSGLPPAFIDVGSAETFRDEAVLYASRIWQSGGQAELHVWPGAFHGFTALVPGAGLSREARMARARWLRRLLRN